jgi:endoglucanase
VYFFHLIFPFSALKKVVNPDGSVTNLIFDVHKYLDSDNSGTNP